MKTLSKPAAISAPLAAILLLASLSACNGADEAAQAPVSNDIVAHEAEPDHAADQAHDTHGALDTHDAVLKPPEGELWATDAPLRAAMTRIKEAVETNEPAWRQGDLGASEAGALAALVEKDVAYMVENCQLAPEPDAALHVLIGRMMGAAAALQADPMSDEGVPRLVSVVQDYEETFDHAEPVDG